METNEKVKNTLEDLIERLDAIEYKLNLLLSNIHNVAKNREKPLISSVFREFICFKIKKEGKMSIFRKNMLFLM